MKKSILIVMVVCLSLVSLGDLRAKEKDNPLSISAVVGYFAPSEEKLDNSISYGIKFFYELKPEAGIDFEVNFANSDIENSTLDVDNLMLHLSYVVIPKKESGEENVNRFYYGGGLTMCSLDLPAVTNGTWSDAKPDKIGGNVLVGYEFTDRFSFELRYAIIGDETVTLSGATSPFTSNTIDLGGLSGMVRFKF